MGSDKVFLKVVNAADAAPTITSTNFHYSLAISGGNVDLDIGPEVAVYGLADGLSAITVQWVEF